MGQDVWAMVEHKQGGILYTCLGEINIERDYAFHRWLRENFGKPRIENMSEASYAFIGWVHEWNLHHTIGYVPLRKLRSVWKIFRQVDELITEIEDRMECFKLKDEEEIRLAFWITN